MKHAFFIIILLLQVFSVACSKNADILTPTNQHAELTLTQSKVPDIPEDWKRIEECGLSFYIPSDFKETKIQPFDSCVKEYRSKNINLSIDLVKNAGHEDGSRGGEYSDTKDFQITKTIVDGQKAETITYYLSDNGGFKDRQVLFYGAVLYVPKLTRTTTT